MRNDKIRRKAGKVRAKLRETIINGASTHRIVARILERVETLPEGADRRLAAIAQTNAILGCGLRNAEALVSEMMV